MLHEYVYVNHFAVYTDNNPLAYTSTAKLDAKGHRWVAGLANYKFNIHYQSEKLNVEAEIQYRIQWNEVVTCEAVQVVIVNVTQCITSPVENYSNSVAVLDALQHEIENGRSFLHPGTMHI